MKVETKVAMSFQHLTMHLAIYLSICMIFDDRNYLFFFANYYSYQQLLSRTIGEVSQTFHLRDSPFFYDCRFTCCYFPIYIRFWTVIDRNIYCVPEIVRSNNLVLLLTIGKFLEVPKLLRPYSFNSYL